MALRGTPDAEDLKDEAVRRPTTPSVGHRSDMVSVQPPCTTEGAEYLRPPLHGRPKPRQNMAAHARFC